jgi:hypothetical protein
VILVLAALATIVGLFITIADRRDSPSSEEGVTESPTTLPSPAESPTIPTTSTTLRARVSNSPDPAVRTPNPPPVPVINYLTDNSQFPDSGNNYRVGRATINGEQYFESLILGSYSQNFTSQMTVVLGRNYKRLQGVIGVDDESRGGLRLRLKLVADGRVLFQRDVGMGEAYPIDVDVTNVYSISFSSDQLLRDADGNGAFGDARASK